MKLDPVADAGDFYDALFRQAEAKQQSEHEWRKDFLADVLTRPLDSINTLWECRTDYSKPANSRGVRPLKDATVLEVLADQFDYAAGPQVSDLLEFVVKAAKAGDKEALSIVNRAADIYSQYKVTE